MKSKWFFLLMFLCIFTAGSYAQIDETISRDDINRNKPEREEWLSDLGFGMFIHWSIDSQLGIVISHSLVGASDDYTNRFIRELPATFAPANFDPYKIGRQARLAGMKYVVFTAKHHSGFCMWDTKTTDFKITNTPYGKDILKEYVDGMRKAGLAVGLYYSPEDFKFLFDHGVTVRRRGLDLDKALTAEYNEFIRRQTNELFSNYGEIDVLFIDGDPKAPCKEEAWKLQPDVVITRGAVNTPEQTLPGIADDNLWESCVTMGTQWQYKPTNDDLKPAGRLIEMLIETRAKGGNLLLNIGLDPDGEIPDPEARNLVEMAAWNFINQEAITGVHPWIITHEENIWFTASGDRKTVYAIITGYPEWSRGERKEFLLGSIDATADTKISVLGQNDKVVEYSPGKDAMSRFSVEENGLSISVVRAQRIYNNNKWPNPVVVKLENVVPALDPPAVITGKGLPDDNGMILQGTLARTGDGRDLEVGFEYRPYAGFVENLYSTEWEKSEFTEVAEDGTFQLLIENPEANTQYEYRAVVVHPRMKIYGDIRRVRTGQ
ncbi:MAG: alpha-L-fucosidase [Bacteroidales bacterium]|jgi:alpha-L-fucosidase|nr:alpha-L-fucosidase [Bacteroidales bacterium]